jgi:beta-lactamase regulating signal transducer with metallopeptidase domain
VNSLSVLSDNLISWWIQVTVIAALGTALPMLFRIRHPRTQIAFYHFVLAVCVALPLIEPWYHPLLIANGSVQRGVNNLPGVSWLSYLVWIFLAGMFVKLCWLAGGYLQIRRYRASATRIFPIPESIRQARALTCTDARFGISRSVDGPATLGRVDPIILLPESFLSLDHDAQLSIVCHELIHVRRNDWLVTLFEEFIATLFWCNPAVWMLQSHTKLSREQLVDSEVVALTAAPASYVHALLVMAGAPRKLKTIPAALFLNDGHLPHRVRLLLTKRSGSTGRLAASYFVIICLLVVFTAATTLWFPLVGQAWTVETFARNHLLPQTLIARTKPAAAAETPSSTFDVHVPVPPEPSRDRVYYSGGEPSTSVEQHFKDFRVLPLPPGLFLQPLRMLEAQGIRVIRPGDRVTPEEIARMQQALGEHTQVEVTQSEDGTVRQIKIQRRRSPDEIHFGPLRFHIGPDPVIPAEPADNADGVH